MATLGEVAVCAVVVSIKFKCSESYEVNAFYLFITYHLSTWKKLVIVASESDYPIAGKLSQQ